MSFDLIIASILSVIAIIILSLIPFGSLLAAFVLLRKKIEADPSEPIYLRTIWGAGYLFSTED